MRSMEKFRSLFPRLRTNLIGMIHVGALPGAPNNRKTVQEIVDLACREAEIYKSVGGIDSVMLENMHDVPYVKESSLGPETVGGMTAVCREVRKKLPLQMPVGVQVLAGANRAALAVALAADLQYIRAEGFVFGHVADEGWIDACAGSLLRYRRSLGADAIAVFCDIKKKHAAHAVTADVNVVETAKAARFFLADGVILTGASTGAEASEEELVQVVESVGDFPVMVGSGVTCDNVGKFVRANALIIGSYFKKDGLWYNDLDALRIERVAEAVRKFQE